MSIARFTVLKSHPTDRAAQSRGRRRRAIDRGQIGPLVGVQDFDGLRLLSGAFPGISSVLTVVPRFYRIGRIILRVGVYRPTRDTGWINFVRLHIFFDQVVAPAGISTGFIQLSSLAENIL